MREIEMLAEASAADALHGPARPSAAARADGPKHADLHAECLNCGARLQGRYCHRCGQAADDHHRSILHLAWEAVEGLTHLDGRLARTVPPLLFRPGRLTRDLLDGRRARHVPPFRLFLISLLLFMLVLEAVIHGDRATVAVKRPDDAKRAAVATASFNDLASGRAKPSEFARKAGADAQDVRELEVNEAQAGAAFRRFAPGIFWLRERIGKALANPEYFKLLVFTWAHRLAVLLLPIFAAQLTLLYAWRRRFYVYDHLLVSMQFLGFVFLVSAAAWLPPEPVRGWTVLAAALWTPVNLFLLLRGAYGSGVVGALVRTAWLWVSTGAVFALLLLGLLALGLQQL